MKLRAIVPVRSLDDGKRRLSDTIDDKVRAHLTLAFLDHLLQLTTRFPGAGATIVVSPDTRVLAHADIAGVQGLLDPGTGLNEAIQAAAERAREDGAEGILVLPIDLPCARPEDVLLLARASTPIAIAPDRRGVGTNALFLRSDLDFRFAFGEKSLNAHIAEALRLGVEATILDNKRLALDIDTPEDVRDWTREPDYRNWKAVVEAG